MSSWAKRRLQSKTPSRTSSATTGERARHQPPPCLLSLLGSLTRPASEEKPNLARALLNHAHRRPRTPPHLVLTLFLSSPSPSLRCAQINSFHDAAIGIVSLSASIYYFGALGRNDVNVLTLLAVAVVAGLNQEVGWFARASFVCRKICYCVVPCRGMGSSCSWFYAPCSPFFFFSCRALAPLVSLPSERHGLERD